MNGITLESLKPRFASQYVLESELGRGGMGVVFQARELSLDRLVAIKVLPPSLAEDDATRERFLREARTAAQLSHPNIVPILRADTIDGLAYFAMGLVEGETLAERLASRGRLAPADAVRIVREIAWALAYAHARGVIHRDVKPENILIERGSGRVMVTDFGIARDERTSGLTAEGTVLGSVHFMSPERIAGEAIDGRSDLYSLGVVAFQLLSGRLPFDAPQPSAVLLMQVTQEPPSLRDVAPDVPMALAEIVDNCLKKSPDERPATCEALAEALAAALSESVSGPQSLPAKVLDEEAAKAIWLRAAQLEADAARRVQERTARAEEFATGMHSTLPTDGYLQSDVEAAAIEAGIGEEFVHLALAELPATDALPVSTPAEGGGRLSKIVLGEVPQSVRVSRIINATPRTVLESVGSTVTSSPWDLVFIDTIGGHPLDGGILNFASVPISLLEYLESGATDVTMRHYLSSLGANKIRISIHPVAGSPKRCEIVITVDIRTGIKKHAGIGVGLSGFLGAAGAGFGTAIGINGGAALFVLPLFCVLPAAALVGVSVWGSGWGFRRTIKKATRQLLQMIDAVGGQARSKEVFGAPPKLPGVDRGGSRNSASTDFEF